MTGFLARRTQLTLALLGALALLALTTRPWIEATVVDTITGTTRNSVRGSTVAPLAFAGSLVALAAVIALMTSRRIGRVIASIALLTAGLLASYAVGAVALDPAQAARSHLAGQAGHADARVREAAATFWVWPTLGVAVLVALLGLSTLLLGRRWHGLGTKYDAPAATKESDWDQLSAGRDPTAADADHD